MKRLVLIGLLLAETFAVRLFAEDKAAVDPPQMAKLKVVVTDHDGEPIAGAEVRPVALGTKKSSTRPWKDRDHGPRLTGVSDKNGVAILQYPPQVRVEGELQPTNRILFQVQHVDFVRISVIFNLGPAEAKAKMARGCELHITAVNEETREPVKQFGVIVAGPANPKLWVDAEDGGRLTRANRRGRWQTMLVKPQADGPTLFSEVMMVPAKPQQAIHLQNIRMSPGAVLRGKLSQNVPRPVNGYVISHSVPSSLEERKQLQTQPLVWYDCTEIAEDGTFEFESLPRGGEVHLMAFCDGWLTQTGQEFVQVNDYKMGQLFKLDEQTLDVELKMEPTGTLEVELLTPEGTRLTEGEVGSWPLQQYYTGGIGVLGQRLSSMQIIKNQFLPPDERIEPLDHYMEAPFQKRVNPDGVTVLTGLPLKFPLSLYLFHDRLGLKDADRINPFHAVDFELKSTTPRRMTLKTMVAKPETQNDTP